MTFRGEQNMKNLLKKLENIEETEENISESEVTQDGKLLLGKNVSESEVTSNGKPLVSKSVSRKRTKKMSWDIRFISRKKKHQS